MSIFSESFDALLRLQDELEALHRNPRSVFGPSGGGAFPPVNVFRNGEGLVVRAELPGLSAQDIDVTFERGVLTVSGERRAPEGKGGYHRRERPWGRFSRSFSLPDDVDPERATAGWRNGILTVRVPQRESTRPRQIAVHSA
jgi:HSP20 family protein